ncbi:hypothetical protein Ancab_017741 [Ancistrocladus abbreviatus]
MNNVYRILAKPLRRLTPQILSPFSISSISSSCYSTTNVPRFTRSKRKPLSAPPPLSPPPELDLSTSPIEIELKRVDMVFNRPRPGEIPFQTKVANSVNFIGTVESPIQFETNPDGKCWAAAVISVYRYFNSPPLRIPVIFEDDLAHTAACHIKEKDNIYIAGQLSNVLPPLALGNAQASLQVVVHSINFVQGFPDLEENHMASKQEPESVDVSDGAGSNEQSKGNLRGSKTASEKKASNTTSSPWDSWNDLINNPGEWRDYRVDKNNGKVNAKYPDFKHKEDGRALWLNGAPKWILPKLDGLEFDIQIKETEKVGGYRGSASSGVESWKNLVENPDKWWDNRSTKRSQKAPDFKNKDTGEVLWLNRAPDWVTPKLPPVKGSTFGKETLLS